MVPQVIRELARRRPGLIPIRLEIFPTDVQWRAVRNLEHATLCAAFGLDPCSYWFRGASSAHGTGSAQVGYGSGSTRRRDNDGLVMRGQTEVGKWKVCSDTERCRDRDPTSREDFFRLGDSR